MKSRSFLLTAYHILKLNVYRLHAAFPWCGSCLVPDLVPVLVPVSLLLAASFDAKH